MAHIQQLYDNINQQFRKIYKEGVWVESYVTKIGCNKKGSVFFECVDKKKCDQGKLPAAAVFRLLDPSNPSFNILMKRLGISFDNTRVHSFEKGEVQLSFKVLPNVHFEKGMLPIIKDIALYEINPQLENLKSGLRIGVSNTQMQKPANTGKLWTKEENEELARHIANGVLSIESIAIILKRTPNACVEQAELIGKLTGDRLTNMRREAKSLSERLCL